MPNEILGKVTAFITRRTSTGLEMLLLQHPYAGNQFPAGTVEAGEPIERAVVREATEETGLAGFTLSRFIGWRAEPVPPDNMVVLQPTSVYARPDSTSFDWAKFSRGVQVRTLRRQAPYIQVVYEEWDRIPEPSYLTYQITGWVPEHVLGQTMHRHFFHLTYAGESNDAWEIYSDNHNFRAFWAPLAELPEIISFQYQWLKYITGELGYVFD